MNPGVIALLVFAAALIIMAVLHKNNTSDRYPLLPGENLLYEEMGLRVEQTGAPQTTVFMKCRVKLTDKRMLISQKTLFGKTFVMRYIITFDDELPQTDLKQSLSSGHLVIRSSRSAVKVQGSGAGAVLQIPIPDTDLTRGQSVVVTSPVSSLAGFF